MQHQQMSKPHYPTKKPQNPTILAKIQMHRRPLLQSQIKIKHLNRGILIKLRLMNNLSLSLKIMKSKLIEAKMRRNRNKFQKQIPLLLKKKRKRISNKSNLRKMKLIPLQKLKIPLAFTRGMQLLFKMNMRDQLMTQYKPYLNLLTRQQQWLRTIRKFLPQKMIQWLIIPHLKFPHLHHK